MKIFISYNHKDQPVALKIRDILLANGFDVIVDADKMRSGEDIEQFIFNCFKDSGVSLSLISVNSLMSAWVAMETVTSLLDEKLRGRVFLPCYVDKDFLERSFTGQAMEKIEAELAEIEGLMKAAIDKGWGIEDLQNERTRYNKLKTALPEIIGTLRNSLCIDLTPDHFEAGMQKIINDLKNGPDIPEAISPIKRKTQDAVGDLRNMIDGAIDELSKQRLINVSQRLSRLQELLDKYEQDLDFETDPKRQMRYEREIENTKQSIQKTLDEIRVM